MFPVRSTRTACDLDFRTIAIAELEILERGLTVVARSLPFRPDLWVDAVGRDADGSPVIVLVEDGTAEPLFFRATEAIRELRTVGPLLSRLTGEGDIDASETPTLVLIARRFPEAVLERLGLLRLPAVRCMEASAVEGANGNRLLVTARIEIRGDSPTVRKVSTGDRVVGTDGPARSEGRLTTDRFGGASGSPNGLEVVAEAQASGRELPSAEPRRPVDAPMSEEAAQIAPFDGDPARRNGVARAMGSEASRSRSAESSHSANGGRTAREGNDLEVDVSVPSGTTRRRRSLLDEVMKRVLRMSPDVFEEADGEVIRFHVGAHRLCTLIPNGRTVLVRSGEATGEIAVVDEKTLQAAVDAVFERFFQLVDARRGIVPVDEPAEDRSENPGEDSRAVGAEDPDSMELDSSGRTACGLDSGEGMKDASSGSACPPGEDAA